MGFNLAETLLRPVLRSAPAQAAIGGLRYAGDHLGLGTGVFADAADMGTRALSGDNRNFNPKDFSKQTQASFKQAIDNAISRGVKADKDGFVAVDYQDYPSTLSGLVSGRLNAKNNPDGSSAIRSDERYDFNASGATDRQAYLKNLDGAMSSAYNDTLAADTLKGKLKGTMRMAANAPDYLNFYTGAGTKGLNIGGQFGGSSLSSKQSTNISTPASPSPPPSPSTSGYVVKGGDTLTEIANNMGVNVNELAKRNNIANANLISVGQTIV